LGRKKKEKRGSGKKNPPSKRSTEERSIKEEGKPGGVKGIRVKDETAGGRRRKGGKESKNSERGLKKEKKDREPSF